MQRADRAHKELHLHDHVLVDLKMSWVILTLNACIRHVQKSESSAFERLTSAGGSQLTSVVSRFT